MPRPFAPGDRPGIQIPLYIPVPEPVPPRTPITPDQGLYDPGYGPQEGRMRQEGTSDFAVIQIGGDEPPVKTEAEMHTIKRVAAAESAVRAMPESERLSGWENILRKEFADMVGNLTALPADAQGHAFHAAFDRPVIGKQSMARLKLWYGSAAENPRPALDAKVATVNLNGHNAFAANCLKRESYADNLPQLEFGSNAAELVIVARDVLEGWAEQASGRTLEARNAVRRGFAPH